MKSKHGKAWRALAQIHMMEREPQPPSASWPSLCGQGYALGVRIPKKVAREYHDWKRKT